ncbi:hypothetical protein GCK32_017843, partial [Trichostrongylus colubriformis]
LLLIVYIALFLDNMLLTTVVPIIPEYLLRISHPNKTQLLLYNKPTEDREEHKIEKRQVSTLEIRGMCIGTVHIRHRGFYAACWSPCE